jgi:hypothetical protein
MTVEEIVEHIAGLRRITRETGCMTRRTQSEFLASLPDSELLAAAPALKALFDAEKAAVSK